jgi:hypothetical protein
MSEKYKFSEKNLRKIAENKVNFRWSVKIHALIFVVVNILLFILNYIFSPTFPRPSDFWWALFPLFGWLAGLMMHFTAYILFSRGVYPMAKRGVIFNVVAYITVNLLLVIINYTTLSTISWAIFPALFWGIGIVLHVIIYLVYYRSSIKKTGEIKSRKERAVEKEMEKMKKRMEKQLE